MAATRDQEAAGRKTDQPLGIELGDFRLARELGRGGMGVVYEAEQVSLGRRVAVKVLPSAGMLDPRQLARFKNEAQAASQLHHPSIVPVYAVGCEAGVHFYAMQLIEGRTLAEIIARLRSSDHAAGQATDRDELSLPANGGSQRYWAALARLGIQAAEALEHAHQHGIVHRDIKPANLLVDARGRLWVTDFGLARIGTDANLTLTGNVLGTLGYMSPEAAHARPGLVDHRTDIYSLGATLYELLALEPVFRGADRQALLGHIADDQPRPPRRINRLIPRDLQTIVLKALEKEPSERYTTAKELADDLRRFCRREPIVARAPTAGQRIARWCSRRQSLAASAAAALLLSLAVSAAAVVSVARERDQAHARYLAAERERREAAVSTEENLRLAVNLLWRQEGHSESFGARPTGSLVKRGYELWAEALPAYRANRHELALQNLREAIAIYRELAKSYPHVEELGVCVVRMYRHLGDVNDDLGNLAEAERDYQKAVSEMERLVEISRDPTLHASELSRRYGMLASNQIDRARYAAAKASRERSLDICERFFTAASGNRKSNLAMQKLNALVDLANLLRDAGQLDAAESYYQRALEWHADPRFKSALSVFVSRTYDANAYSRICYAYAQHLTRRPRIKEAEEMFNRATGPIEGPIDPLRDFLRARA